MFMIWIFILVTEILMREKYTIYYIIIFINLNINKSNYYYVTFYLQRILMMAHIKRLVRRLNSLSQMLQYLYSWPMDRNVIRDTATTTITINYYQICFGIRFSKFTLFDTSNYLVFCYIFFRTNYSYSRVAIVGNRITNNGKSYLLLLILWLSVIIAISFSLEWSNRYSRLYSMCVSFWGRKRQQQNSVYQKQSSVGFNSVL